MTYNIIEITWQRTSYLLNVLIFLHVECLVAFFRPHNGSIGDLVKSSHQRIQMVATLLEVLEFHRSRLTSNSILNDKLDVLMGNTYSV